MLKKIARFIEFDLKRLGVGAVQEEFNHKYKDSWLVINDKLMLVAGLHVRGVRVELHASPVGEGGLILEDIQSIAPFNPKTGLYSAPEGLIYLHRVPARQWTKGFKIGKNYQHKTLIRANPNRDVNVVKLLNHKDVQYHPETQLFQNKLFLHWKHVGDFKEETQKLHLKNNHFIKEIQELWPQLQITLDAVSPKKPMVERLILDF